jgi:hypothetical protein
LPANACLARLACNGIPAGPGFQSRCNQNREVLRKITTDIGTEAQFNQRTSGGNLNPLDPNQILAASDSERDRLEALIMRSFDRYVNAGIQQGFTVGGSVDFLRTKIKTQLERCHNMSRRQFAELYNTNRSSRNPVRAALEEYRKKQLELEGDLDRWIRVVADRMTKFRAKFTSTFDSTLKQFHQDCRSTSAGSSVAGADATAGSGRSQQMLACLETLKQRLEGGLNGTNGEGATIIQIPVINGTPGAQGSSNQIVSQQCQGFKDCIVKLDLAKKIHGEQKDALVSQRQAQASQHNQIVEGILDQVGAAFNTAMNSPNGLKGMLARVNNLLTQNGIASQLNPKERDKEELVKDDKINPDDPKSQIYKNPTNILSVLAQRGGLQEIKQEDVNDIKKAIEDKLNGSGSGDSNNGIISRIATANRTMGRARTKLAQCTPGESDYRAINDYLGGCNDIQRICRRGIMGTLGQLERIGSIVANDSNDGRDSGLNRREQNMDTYQRCLREMRENDRLTSGDSSLERILASRDGGSRPFSQQTRDPLTQLETEFACYEQARGGINQLFGRARPDYRGRHNSMMSSMDQLIGACEGYRTDHLNSMEPVDEANRAVASSENNEITRCRAETGPNGSLNTRLSDLERDHDQVVNAVMAQARAQTAVPYGPEPEIGRQGRILRQNFTRILGSYFGRTKSAISEGVRGGIVVAAGTGFLRDFFLNPDTYFNDMRTSLAPSLTAQDRAVLAPANLPAFRVFVEEVLKPAWSDNQTNPGLAAIVNGYTDKANRLADDFANCMRTARSNAAGRTAHRREVASGVVSTHDDAIRTACQAVTSEANALGERAGSDRRNRSDGNETPIFDQPAR